MESFRAARDTSRAHRTDERAAAAAFDGPDVGPHVN